MSTEIGTSILMEAQKFTTGSGARITVVRLKSFELVARLWSEVLGSKVEAHQVVLWVIQLKISRAMQTPGHRDSWVDIVGYAGLADKILGECAE